MMRWWTSIRRTGIGTKLNLVAVLSAIAVAVLAIASFHFARVTELAASQLYHDGFEGVESSAQLLSLLEQHRRIVESAPAEVDRTRLTESQRAMIEKGSHLLTLINALKQRPIDPSADLLEEQIAVDIPPLLEAGQDVLFDAYNFAQDKALEQAKEYSRIADGLQRKIQFYRTRRSELAEAAVERLRASGHALIFWVSVSAITAFVLIGPLGLTITRSVLARLDRITAYMVRLARSDATEEVPSRDDHDEVGDMARAVQVFKDNARELRLNKAQLEKVNLQLDAALNTMMRGLSMFDADKNLIVCNIRYGEMYGIGHEFTRSGTALRSILEQRKLSGTLPESVEDALRESAYLASKPPSSLTKELPDGRIISVSHQPMANGGWLAVHEDVTERRRAEAQIAHLARHDQLTGLPNRTFFREGLEEAFHRLRRGARFALFCLDLDGFKSVNDSLGHPIGDLLLKSVGARLNDCVNPNDFVARLGGDEFAVIHSTFVGPEDCSRLAEQIIRAISAPYVIENQQINIGASIGIAVAPHDGDNPDQLLKNADMAMYRAKADGRGSHRMFEPEMDARIQARRALELDLRTALAAGELELYYQPMVSAATSKVTGFEALLRWFHPRLGEVPPSEFIPLAEETGLIGPLGEWVLRTACHEAATWPQPASIAVNLSPAQFKNGNLVQSILSALAAAALPAHRLELEITESVLLQDDTRTLAVLHQLRSLGIHVAMDDFGTGYSSLSYLRSFPFDKIKIDRSFIRDIENGGEALAIVRAIIHLARSLNISVVAEGVETVDQYRLLQAEGVAQIQGFLLSRPQPAAQILDMLKCGDLRPSAAA
jgi:diguanylate cyclase (GGDEF)-like protein